MVTFANRAKVSTSTTGTGTITLGTAVDGYQSFTSAGVVNSDVVRYTIEDGDAWEIGSGTYSAGTLTRVLDESSTGSLLNLSGEAVVYVTAAGEDIVQPSDLATVATSGAYSDLSGLPTLGTAAAADTGDFATAAQGALADSALQSGDNVSALTNDAGYTTNVGDITGVTAGTGLSGGGTSGSVTLSGVTQSQATWEVGTSSTEGVVSPAKISAAISALAGGGGGASALTIDDKTGAYTVVSSDIGKIINCTIGSFTVSLTAAATLGAGFYFYVIYTGSGTGGITIDPAGSEKINVAYMSYKVNARSTVKVFTDGSNWFVLDTSHVGISQLNTTFSGTLPAATVSSATAIGYRSGGGVGAQAAGSGAMALGGSRASGTDSFAAAIANNTSSYGATGTNSVAMGGLSRASSTRAVSLGYSTTASSLSAVALGGFAATASEPYSFASGYNALANRQGKFSYSGQAGNWGLGFSQMGVMVLYSDTTAATPEALTANNSTPSAQNQVVLPNNSAYAFHGTIVAREQASSGTACAAWKIEGLIRREGSAGTTVLVNSATTVLDNTPSWGLALSANTTNGGLKIEATGAVSTNIRWVATIHTSEVTY